MFMLSFAECVAGERSQDGTGTLRLESTISNILHLWFDFCLVQSLDVCVKKLRLKINCIFV